MTRKKKDKKNVKIQVTGRSVAYIQPYKKGGKLGKPQAVVITTVRPKVLKPAKKK